MRRGIGRLRAGGSGFSPLSLFAAGEQGAWYDPSDFSTMWQDSAGTTPVTAVGQPVGKVLDKSGRGNHKTQSTTTQRPLLQQDGSGFYYLSYDGVDDTLLTASITFACSKATVCLGLLKSADPAEAEVYSGTGSVKLEICAPDFQSAGGAKGFSAQVSSTGFSVNYASNLQAPISRVVTAVVDNTTTTSGVQSVLRVNGATGGTFTTGAVVAQFSAGTIQLGTRGGSNPFAGRIYGVVARYSDTALTALQLAALERYVGSTMGIAL